MKIRARFLLLLPLLALSACGYTTVRSSSDYASVLSREPMLVLPAKAEAFTVGMGGQERMYDYEEYIEPVIMEELVQALQAKGYRATILRKPDLMPDKRYVEYEGFASAFDNKMESLYVGNGVAKREVAENTSVHLDGKAKLLGDKLAAPVMAAPAGDAPAAASIDAPVLVYARYNEQVKTGGTEAVEFATGVLMTALTGYNPGSEAPDKASMRISIVDTKRDRLLWTNAGNSQGGTLIDDMMHDNKAQSLKHVKNTIQFALMGLPDKDKLFEPQK